MLRNIAAIAQFEIRYHLQQPLFYVLTGVMALMGFGMMASDAISSNAGNVYINSPFMIVNLLTGMTLIAMFVITVFVASAAQRDFELGTGALFFSKPIHKLDYLGGRLLGSLAVSVLVFVGCCLGLLIGTTMPWIDAEQLGAFSLSPFLWAFGVIILPNLLFLAALFFSLAALSRSLLLTYVAVVVFFGANMAAGLMLQEVENRMIASLVDPFGATALDLATRYWTTEERNTLLPSLGEGGIGINRLIWTAAALAIFAATVFVFNPARTGKVSRRRRKLMEAGAAAAPAPLADAFPKASQSFSTAGYLRQLVRQARIEVAATVKSVLFLVLLLIAVGLTVLVLSLSGQLYGTSVYPVTSLMLDLQGMFMVMLIIIVTFYSGELVWKERSVKLHEVYDALPVPTGVILSAKLVALFVVMIAFLGTGALTLIGYQLTRGYYNIDPGLYLASLLISVYPFLLVAVLAVFLQVLTNNKFLGYLLMIIYLISDFALSALDLNHNLYRYADRPGSPYSDMNGFGHFLEPMFWFSLYWTFFALLLYGLSLALKLRGTDASRQARLQQARARFRGPARALVALGLLGFVATGAFIFYNTNVLNEYVAPDERMDRQADFEKKYRKYLGAPMPRIVGVRTEVDLYPEERRMEARGRYRLRNKTSGPVRDLYMNLDNRVELRRLVLPAHERVLNDEKLGFSIYRLAKPLAPGEEIDLEFEVAVENPGFVNSGSDTSLAYNGTFFNNSQYFPSLGYHEGVQLIDRNERRKRGLPPVIRMAKIDDQKARLNNYITRDSDWIDFETVVSTTPGQIAIAPGYLQREWTRDGRRYFHYKMDAPILHFYSYLSADYKVKRDRWKDVNIEIYYHEPHSYNIDRMIDSVKKSLDYFTTHFGPYQHRQVRILEFPRYQSFAQSFANTIPYSEGVGFIADLRDEEAIDYVFYITAHEVAHQWWAHQVIGGNVQGATMLSESMSQYASLMVMEKEYGRDKMRRFLKYELDQYLMARGAERVEEMPLMLVENQQYIHYQKGSLILYALRDYIGEEALNRALARYVQSVKFQQPPYTTTAELMPYLEEATPPHLRYVLEDMFRTITLFENRVTEATYRRRADGKYDVDLTVEAKKSRAGGKGEITPVPINDWIDIGVFAEEEKGGKSEETTLYFKKHHVTQPTTRLQLVVDRLPARAGIDPYNKLVDRDSNDNRKRVTEASGKAAASR